ncbi:MAG: PAS domain S-box protein [Candidatus Latescibacteria bacterium]|nr:PAS domain S-box protein [Candidatus Latescibacterota bacterium]
MEALKILEAKCTALENTVKQYEQRLKIIMNNIPDVVYMLDPEGKIVFISDSIKQYGYEPKELTGTNMMDIIYPLDKIQASYGIKERRTGRRKTKAFNVRILTKDKTAVPIEIKSKEIESAPLFSIVAEGYYGSTSNSHRIFLGTVGVARGMQNAGMDDESSDSDILKDQEFIPVCSHCKMIRDTDGKWNNFEDYLSKALKKEFTHSICPSCIKQLYPEFEKDLEIK